MANQTVRTGGGMGLLGWLFIVFLVLKLNPGGNLDTPVADWSWWLVTAPLWGPLALFLVGGIIFGIGWLVLKVFESKEEKNIRKARSALRNYSRSLKP